MKRTLKLIACLAVTAGTVTMVGCTPGRSLSRETVYGTPTQRVSYGVVSSKAGPMPLAVGDALGTSVFTTHKSLAARGIDDGTAYASGEPTKP